MFAPLALLAVAVVALAVAVVRRRRARAELAARWVRLEQQRASARAQGAFLVQAVNVYQRARRGSKAWVVWCDTGVRQDTWFWHWHVPPGAYVLVRGGSGFGPHNRNPNVLYVERGDVLAWVPSGAPAAWRAITAQPARS